MAISTGAAILGSAAIGALGSNIAGNKAANAAEDAAATQAAAQREALEYQKQVEKPVLDIRNQALPQLAGFYGIGEDTQQDIINRVQSSPFYQANLEQMEEAIFRNQSATGGLRTGDTQSALATESSNLLQGLTNQQLQGMSAFAFPNLNTNAIAGRMAGIGQTQAQGMTAAAGAKQQGLGQALNAITQGITAYANQPQQPVGLPGTPGFGVI